MLRFERWENLGEEESFTRFKIVFSDENYTDKKLEKLTTRLSQFIIHFPLNAKVEPVNTQLFEESPGSSVTAEIIIRYPTNQWPKEREIQNQIINNIRDNIMTHISPEF